MGKTLAEKVWDEHVVRSADGEPDLLFIDLHLIHEVTSPQAFEGLRLAGPSRTPPRPHPRHRGPQRPDARLGQADRRSREPHAGRDAASQRRGVRRPAAPARRHRPGHRPHHRAAARADPARHDHRLRRLPHQHPRRVRRAGLRHRHQRGRARPRHPDPAAGAAEDDGRDGQRRAARGRHRQGPRAHADHPHRHGRRPGLRRGVPRSGHRGALDGGPDDGLQHEHRVGCQGRPDRARPEDPRLPRGPQGGAEGRGVGRRRRLLGRPSSPTTTRSSTRRSSSTRAP